MKKYIVLPLVLLAATACKKNHNDARSPLEGMWELRYSAGAWSPATHWQPGNGIQAIFSGTQYRVTRPNQPDRTSTFRLERDLAYFLGPDRAHRFVTADETDSRVRTYVTIKGDTLRMTRDSPELPDAYSLNIYVRTYVPIQ